MKKATKKSATKTAPKKVAAKTASKKVVKSSTEVSVENGIKIINTAIKKKLSLSEAARQHNFGRNYVSDIKARIADNYKKKNINKELYTSFTSLLKTYNA